MLNRLMHIPTPLPLGRLPEPFDDPDWLYEIKHDGFRALAVIDQGQCRFFSRNRHRLNGFDELGRALVDETKADTAILDGELAVIDPDGRSLFAAMMTGGRHLARFFAFDVVSINGTDLRQQPLIERKRQLRQMLPRRSRYVLYVDHVRGTGKELFHWACVWDLEGIVAKRVHSPYEFSGGCNLNRSPWLKIKNPAYSQKDGREELFEKRQQQQRPSKRTTG
jgi:bifunctional non-homologous end joining protein LigD